MTIASEFFLFFFASSSTSKKKKKWSECCLLFRRSLSLSLSQKDAFQTLYPSLYEHALLQFRSPLPLSS